MLRENPAGDRAGVEQRVREQYELIESGRMCQSDVCAECDDLQWSDYEPHRLVRDRLPPKPISQGIEQPAFSRKQLKGAGERAHLAREFLTGCDCDLISARVALDNDAIASPRDSHRNQKIVDDRVQWNRFEQLLANRVNGSGDYDRRIDDAFARTNELFVLPVRA